jgi:hypothetical protein
MTKALREELFAPFIGQCELGGCRYFRGVPLKVLEKMVDHGFVELEGWNDCPGVTETFLPFLRRHPEYTAHGHVVSWDGTDPLVCVKGVEKAGDLTKDEISDFARAFAGADELLLSSDYAKCRYD